MKKGVKTAMAMENEIENENDILSGVEEQIIRKKVAEKEALREASGVISDKAKAAGGVLHKLVTVAEERRQQLALASFESREEAANVVAAIREAKRYGVSDEAIFDLVSAYMGVASKLMSRVEWGIQGLTHLEINQPNRHKFSWRGKKEEEKPQ